MAYESTSVPVERSQGEIRKLLARAGASRVAFSEERDDTGRRWAAVQFVVGLHAVRIHAPLKEVDEREVRRKLQRARVRSADEIRDGLYEQEERRIWRVLAWNLKDLLDPRTNRTIFQQLAETGTVQLEQPLHALPAGDDA